MSMFHERLKELKDKSGRTQQKIAEDLNITPQALSYYINGREPNYDIMISMADYFGTTTDFLLGRTNIENQTLDSINKITGLSVSAINSLITLKMHLDNWDDGKKELYLSLFHQAFDHISDSAQHMILPKDMDAMFDTWINHQHQIPSAINHQISDLLKDAADFSNAYEQLKVLNRIIRTQQEDNDAYLLLCKLYQFLFDQNAYSRELYLLSPMKKEGATYDEFFAAMKSFDEAMLVRHVYNIAESVEDDDHGLERYENLYLKINSWPV